MSVYTAHLPSFDSVGALIDFHLSQSAWVSTFFWACATIGSASTTTKAAVSFLIENVWLWEERGAIGQLLREVYDVSPGDVGAGRVPRSARRPIFRSWPPSSLLRRS